MTAPKADSHKNPAAVSLGRKGGEATKKKRGKAYFRELGRRGAIRRWKSPESRHV